MFRYLIVPVLLALLLVPDWAEAIGRRNPIFARRAQPVTCAYPVQYSQPVYYSAPPVQSYPCAPCCPTAPAVAPAKPTVVPDPMPMPVKPKSNVQSEPLAQPKAIEPEPSFKPAAGTETLPIPKDPIPVVPVPKPKEPEIQALPALPMLKDETPLPKLKLEEPKPVDVPKLDIPKLDLPAIPPLLRPDPVPKQSTVRSSPLNSDKLSVDRFPVDGAAPESPGALRLVTFYNFSGRELKLTIAGKEVTVPSKHSVEAKLPATFAWQIGTDSQAEGAIPLTAPGLDIIIGK